MLYQKLENMNGIYCIHSERRIKGKWKNRYQNMVIQLGRWFKEQKFKLCFKTLLSKIRKCLTTWKILVSFQSNLLLKIVIYCFSPIACFLLRKRNTTNLCRSAALKISHQLGWPQTWGAKEASKATLWHRELLADLRVQQFDFTSLPSKHRSAGECVREAG